MVFYLKKVDYGFINGEFVYPPLLNLSIKNISNNEIYLVDDGKNIFIYIGN